MSRYTLLICISSLLFALPAAPQTTSVAPAVGEAVYEEQSSAQPSEAPKAISKSEIVTRIDMQLGDSIIHSNVLNYKLPAELSAVAEKCSAIITRNTGHFTSSPVPAVTPSAFHV